MKNVQPFIKVILMSFLLIGSYVGIASVDTGVIDPLRAYASEADPVVDTGGSGSAIWQAVGDEGFANVGTARTELPGAGNNYLSMAMSGSTPYVAYEDGGNGSKATVMKFDGTNWMDVGKPGFSAGQVSYISMAMSGNTPYVAYRDSGKLTVMMLYYSAETPTIGAQPVGATVKLGDASPELTVEASVADGGTLSYQWYSHNENNNSGGTAIDGATNATYAAPTSAEGKFYYYVEITNTNNEASGEQMVSAVSEAVAVTVEVEADPVLLPQISAGNNHVMWMRNDGAAWAWGDGQYGQLGNHGGNSSFTPTATEMTDVKKAELGVNHTLWLKHDGSVYAAGLSNYGQLGNGIIDTSGNVYHAPVKILDDIIDIAAGDNYSLALKSDGTVWGWGNNDFRQLGLVSESPYKVAEPTKIEGLSNIQKLFAGGEKGFAIDGDGKVWYWGMNWIGMEGGKPLLEFKSGRFPGSEPTLLPDLTGVTEISAGSGFTLFLKTDGTVWAVGLNDYGQLANETTVLGDVIAQVNGLSNIVSISSSRTHNLALTGDGNVYTWGAIDSREPGGIGNTVEVQQVPLIIPELTDVIAIEAVGPKGYASSFAVKADYSVWGWGDGERLGIGRFIDFDTPQFIAFETIPTLEEVSLSGDNSEITFTFNRELAYTSMNQLEGKISLARDGVHFETVVKGDNTFYVSDATNENKGKLIVFLWTELQGDKNVIKVEAGALQDPFGNMPGEVVTDFIIATDHTYSMASVDDQIAPELQVGYISGSPVNRKIDIHNTGTIRIKDIEVTLSGSDGDAFAITQPFSHPYAYLPVDGVASFNVQAVDGLTVGTYTTEVVVSSRGETYATFKVTQVVNPLDAPANVVAVSGDGQVELSWDTVTNATYYNLYMSTTSGLYTEPIVVDIEDTEYRVQDLENGETYYFTVRAGYGADLSEASDEVGEMPIQQPVIDSEPIGVTVKLDDSRPVLSVAASVEDSGTLSYQWYSNSVDSNIGGGMIAGATDDTYAAPTDTEGVTYYYAEVTNTNDGVQGEQTASAMSEAAAVSVVVDAATPTIETQPVGATVKMNESNLVLRVVASIEDGGTLSYQWYSNSTDSNSGGTIIIGATNDTYTAPTSVESTFYYYVEVTNTNDAASGAKTITTVSVVAAVSVVVDAATPTIEKEPVGATVKLGDPRPELTVGASAGDGGTLSYQWFSNSTNDNSGGMVIDGATNATYEAPTSAEGTFYYYVEVTNTNDAASGAKTITTVSAVAAVSVVVDAETPTIETQPVGATVKMNESNLVLHVVASVEDDGTLSYQWYSNSVDSTSGGLGIIGATDDSYAVPTGTEGTTYYYVEMTNTNSAALGEQTATVTSEVATVTVVVDATTPTIDTQPVGAIVKLGDPHPVLRVVASVEDSGTLSYQWYKSSMNSTSNGTKITKATNATYEAPTGTEGTFYYYVEVTNTNIAVSGAQTITAMSEAAQVTVNLPNAPDAPQRLTALAGDRQVTLGWETVTGATYYHLYISNIPGQYDDAISISVTDATYHMKDLTNGTPYYFIVKAESHPGVLSAASNKAHAIPLTVPVVPTGVTAVAGDRSAVVSFSIPDDDGGSPITDYEVSNLRGNVIATGTSSPIAVTGLSNGETYRFIVKAINRAGKSVESTASNEVVPSAQSNNGGNGGNDGDDQGDDDQTGPVFPPVDPPDDLTPEGEEQETQVDILVNGDEINAGKSSTTTINDQQIIIIAVDSERLGEYLVEGNQGDVISIPVLTPADVVRTTFNGQLIKSMEQSGALIELVTEHATYTIPASQLQIDAVVKQLGSHLTLKDVEVQIEISSPTADQLRWIEAVAENGEFTIVAPPLYFAVTGVYEGTSIEISTFSTYIERTIAIPDDVDPGKMTTAVVVEEDGTVRHVPTKIVFESGRYIAVINSLTNSTYALIWNPVAFRDVADHWAKDAVNNMGARKIVSGIGENIYQPNRDITRAEFAAIVVRALGLKTKDGPTPFTDVKKPDWYSEAVQTAYTYNLISGYADGTFRPMDKITREQAMVIIAKAMEITKLMETLGGRVDEHLLHAYVDADQVSNWAKSGVTRVLQASIISGRTHTELAPKANITRAEVAVIVEQLLQSSKLIW